MILPQSLPECTILCQFWKFSCPSFTTAHIHINWSVPFHFGQYLFSSTCTSQIGLNILKWVSNTASPPNLWPFASHCSSTCGRHWVIVVDQITTPIFVLIFTILPVLIYIKLQYKVFCVVTRLNSLDLNLISYNVLLLTQTFSTIYDRLNFEGSLSRNAAIYRYQRNVGSIILTSCSSKMTFITIYMQYFT